MGVSGSHNTITKNLITVNVAGHLIINQNDVSTDARKSECQVYRADIKIFSVAYKI